MKFSDTLRDQVSPGPSVVAVKADDIEVVRTVAAELAAWVDRIAPRPAPAAPDLEALVRDAWIRWENGAYHQGGSRYGYIADAVREHFEKPTPAAPELEEVIRHGLLDYKITQATVVALNDRAQYGKLIELIAAQVRASGLLKEAGK